MVLILQIAQDLLVRLDKAIHGHVCLRYQYHLSALLLNGIYIFIPIERLIYS